MPNNRAQLLITAVDDPRAALASVKRSIKPKIQPKIRMEIIP